MRTAGNGGLENEQISPMGPDGSLLNITGPGLCNTYTFLHCWDAWLSSISSQGASETLGASRGRDLWVSLWPQLRNLNTGGCKKSAPNNHAIQSFMVQNENLSILKFPFWILFTSKAVMLESHTVMLHSLETKLEDGWLLVLLLPQQNLFLYAQQMFA